MAEGSGVDSVDFEIALTALLATLVTAYPSPGMAVYPAIKLGAIGLLVITLIKRVGIRNGLTAADGLLLGLTHLMDPLTSLSFLYCAYIGVRWVLRAAGGVPSASVLTMAVSIVAVVIALGLLVTSELIFGEQLREITRIFDDLAATQHGTPIGYVGRRLSAHLRRQRDYGRISIQTTLIDPQFYDPDLRHRSPDQRSKARWRWAIIFGGFALALLVYAALLVTATILAGVAWPAAALLLFASLFVNLFFELVYSRYGLLRAEARSRFVTPVMNVLTYAGAILLVT